jgi:hypothetical protein
LELSAEAFINLSKRFRGKTKDWLEEDKEAQQTRQKHPESMDIYDISKAMGMQQSYSPIYSVLMSALSAVSCKYTTATHFGGDW